MIRYNTSDDASLRLNSSLVRYKGSVYYCKVVGNCLCRLYLFENLLENTIEDTPFNHQLNYNDPELCIDAIDVGYVNYVTDTKFVTRPPYRKQKQGSNTENLVVFNVGSVRFASLDHTQFFTGSFVKALKNDYPTLKECVESLKAAKKILSRAFSKNFCIQKIITEDETLELSFNLFYDNLHVGTLIEGKVKIFPESMDSILVHKLAKLGVHI